MSGNEHLGEKISLVLADDHEVIRMGLRILLSTRPEFEILGEAASGREAVAVVKKVKPMVVVMDLGMPRLNGMEATRQILRWCPDIKVVALSSYGDREHVWQALVAGAAAYVLKGTEPGDLLSAILEVKQGRRYFSPPILEQLRKWGLSSEAVQASGPAVSLSPREAEILQLIAEGMAQKQIARELGLRLTTVNSHRKELMRKLDLHCLADLVRLAINRKAVETDDEGEWHSAE